MEPPITILQRIADGDRGAVDECIDRYGPLVWTIVRRFLKEPSEIDDFTQEVFIELWRRAERFDPGKGRESTFVSMIARRRSIDMLRKRSSVGAPQLATVTIEDTDLASAPLATEEVMGDSIERVEELERAIECLNSLEAIKREVMVMNFRDGHSLNQIAKSLGMPIRR